MENLRLGLISDIRSDRKISRRVKIWLRNEGNSFTLENLPSEMFHRMMEELGINRPTEDPRHSIPKELNATGSLYHTVEQREDFPQFPPRIQPMPEGGVQGEGLGKHLNQKQESQVDVTVDMVNEPNNIEEQETLDEDASDSEPVPFTASPEMAGAASSIHAEHLGLQLPNRQDEDSTDEESAEGSLISDTTSVSSRVPDTPIPHHGVAPQAQGLIAGATAVPHGQLYDQNQNAFQAINCLTRMLEDLMNRNIEPGNRGGEQQHLQILGIKIEELNMEIARFQGVINALKQDLLAKEDEKENNIRIVYSLHEKTVERKRKMKELKKKHVKKIEEFEGETSAIQEELSRNAEALERVLEEFKLLKEKCKLQKEKLEAYEKKDGENKQREEQMASRYATLEEELNEKILNEVQKLKKVLEDLVAYRQKHGLHINLEEEHSPCNRSP